MKIRFCCNSGANVYSKRYEDFELAELGYTEEEWNDMSENDKQTLVNDWASEKLEIYWQEIE